MKATAAVYLGCALASITLTPSAMAQSASADQEAQIKSLREQIRALNWIKGPQRVRSSIVSTPLTSGLHLDAQRKAHEDDGSARRCASTSSWPTSWARCSTR
jgi:hypothetical protein